MKEAINRRDFHARLLAGMGALSVRPARGASGSSTVLWPGGIIPFLAPVTHPFWKQIYLAIHELNEKTNVHFEGYGEIPRVSYVGFPYTGEGNRADVGYPGPPEEAVPGLFVPKMSKVFINKNVRSLHELGHVCGLIHEQQRSDRDQYIEFTAAFPNRNRLLEGQDANWSIITDSNNGGLPYNVGSFMQYWDTADSDKEPKQRTMIHKMDRDLRWDTPEWINPGAVDAVNALYPTPASSKKFVPTIIGNAPRVLWNSASRSYLSGNGSSHIRSYLSDYLSQKTNAEDQAFKSDWSLRWEALNFNGTSCALYCRHTDSYLDAGPDFLRKKPDRKVNEEETNPYLRWEIVRQYNYYLIYNRLTDSYLNAGPGPGHTRSKPDRKEYETNSNPHLRWLWSDAPQA